MLGKNPLTGLIRTTWWFERRKKRSEVRLGNGPLALMTKKLVMDLNEAICGLDIRFMSVKAVMMDILDS